MAEELTWEDMTDDEIEAAVREIIASSTSDEEIERRIDEELDYPGEVAINSTSNGPLRSVTLLMNGHDRVIEI